MEFQNKLKILTIGGTGLVGSRVNEILYEKYSIKELARYTGTDITDLGSLTELYNPDYQFVILYAAKTDVDSCEKDKHLGENGMAYKINVLGVQNVVEASKSTKKKIIYISTDFVFDGENTPRGGYTEVDTPNPINWYARTKYLGEKLIQNSGLPFLIIRIGYPYRKEFGKKNDFTRAIFYRLKNNHPVVAVTDHIMTPTFIDDIANALDILISEKKEGIFHVTGNQSLCPYAAAKMIAQKFGLNKPLITPTTRAEFFRDRAPRPFNLSMNNAKIQKLGIRMKTFTEGLKELKR